MYMARGKTGEGGRTRKETGVAKGGGGPCQKPCRVVPAGSFDPFSDIAWV